MLFAWRVLMLAAMGTGGALLLNSLVAAAIGFITKLLCNLLLMSCTKLFNG
jgi:hypothetical protein